MCRWCEKRTPLSCGGAVGAAPGRSAKRSIPRSSHSIGMLSYSYNEMCFSTFSLLCRRHGTPWTWSACGRYGTARGRCVRAPPRGTTSVLSLRLDPNPPSSPRTGMLLLLLLLVHQYCAGSQSTPAWRLPLDQVGPPGGPSGQPSLLCGTVRSPCQRHVRTLAPPLSGHGRVPVGRPRGSAHHGEAIAVRTMLVYVKGTRHTVSSHAAGARHYLQSVGYIVLRKSVCAMPCRRAWRMCAWWAAAPRWCGHAWRPTCRARGGRQRWGTTRWGRGWGGEGEGLARQDVEWQSLGTNHNSKECEEWRACGGSVLRSGEARGACHGTQCLGLDEFLWLLLTVLVLAVCLSRNSGQQAHGNRPGPGASSVCGLWDTAGAYLLLSRRDKCPATCAQAWTRFLEHVFTSVVRHVDFNIVKCLVIAGASGWVRRQGVVACIPGTAGGRAWGLLLAYPGSY